MIFFTGKKALPHPQSFSLLRYHRITTLLLLYIFFQKNYSNYNKSHFYLSFFNFLSSIFALLNIF